MIHHVSHTDLDGIGCHVVAHHFFSRAGRIQEFRRYNADYSDVDRVIAGILDEAEDPGFELLITDLSPTMAKTINRLKSVARRGGDGAIRLIDHHQTALERLGQMPWAHVDTSHSGTWLTYEHFDRQMARLGIPRDRVWKEQVADFAAVVNDYDLWIHRDARSDKLNILLGLLGIEEFFARFADNPEVRWSSVEAKLIDVALAQRERYLSQAAQTATLAKKDGHSYVRVFAEQYVGQLAERLLEQYTDAAFVVVFNLQRQTGSLRSRHGEFDCSQLAKHLGGGGHPSASGFPITEKNLKL